MRFIKCRFAILLPFALALLFLTAPGCGKRRIPGGDASTHDGSWGDGYTGSENRPRKDSRPRDKGKILDRKTTKDRRLPDKKVKPPKDTGPKPCSKMGLVCASDKDCCSGMTCAATFNGARLCTRSCTPDDPKTPLANEDNCPGSPSSFICANIASPPTTTYRCLQRCVPTKGKNTCPAGLACNPKSTWMTVSVDEAVCGFKPCATGKDCPVYFTKLCSPTIPITHCVGLPTGTFCAPHYPGSFGGRCAQPGVCEKSSGLCVAHKLGNSKAKVGDPCLNDQDCGGSMECLMEVSTSGTVYFRNGYCSVEGCIFAKTFSERACPSGSVCSSRYYGGRCLKSCDINKASTCRGYSKDKHGDYDCRAWNFFYGSPLKAPVCEPGYAADCSYFTGTKYTCAVVGLSGNPTKMACRQPGTGKILSDYSPWGTCLDTTASGPYVP